jgi:DNA-directed RNA polymerase specialized sigma24 family protein
MELIQTFEDHEVRQLLMGEDDDLEAAFTLIDAHLRKRFVKGARERLPGLLPEDLADAWQETLKDLLESLRSWRFDADRELGPWLWTTFLRRAFDSVRRRESYASMMERAQNRLKLKAEEVVDLLDQMGEEDRACILDCVRQAVRDLPARQRTVLKAFVEHFPRSQDLDSLRVQVSQLTGRQETSHAVRRALQEAKRRVSDVLRFQSA